MPLNLWGEALGIAGSTLMIVDTCLKPGDLAETAAKTRGKIAKCIDLSTAKLGS